MVLFYLPSIPIHVGGRQYEMAGLFRYYPKHPARWANRGLTNVGNKGFDPLSILNQEIASDRRCRPDVPASEAAPAGAGLAVKLPRALKAKIAALDRKYPECSLRPLPPEPRLCTPVRRDEFCRLERDWKDVQPVQWSPSPDSPLKRAMMRAIVRAVAVGMLEDPGHNQVLVHDFNVDDKGAMGAVVDRKGFIVQRFGVRLDKDDPCLAEVDALISAGCSPCTDEMRRLDPRTRRQMLLAYPESP